MSDTHESNQIYYIPDNFTGTASVHLGQWTFRLRYLADSIGLSLVLGLSAFVIIHFAAPNMSFESKISAIVITIAPGFLLGQMGYNGDPISTVILHYFKWVRTRAVRLYNATPRLLSISPVKAIQDENESRDKIVTAVTNFQKRRAQSRMANLQEGEFEFTYDPSIDGLISDDPDEYDDIVEGSTEDIVIDSETGLKDLVQLLYEAEAAEIARQKNTSETILEASGATNGREAQDG